MSAVVPRERDGERDRLQGHLEQARRWCSDLVGAAQDIDRWTKILRRDPERSTRALVCSEVIQRVSRATSRQAAAIESTMESLRLLGPAERDDYLCQVVPSVSLTERLLAEVTDSDIYVSNAPQKMAGWTDAAVAMAQRLYTGQPTKQELRDLLVRSLSARIETKLILDCSPGEVEEDLRRLEGLLQGVEKPPDDPSVVIHLWRALGRSGLRISWPEAMELVDLALAVARAFGFRDEEILVELLAAEAEWIAGQPGRAEAHFALALKLCDATGGEPVSAWLVLTRHALAAALAGDPPIAFRSLRALEGERLPPEGSLARREQRLRRLVVAYSQTDPGALEAAARDLSLPDDAWGHWWATQTRLERIRRSLTRKGGWELPELVALLLKAIPSPSPRAARALDALRDNLTEETLQEASRVLHELGPRGAWKDGEDESE